MERTYIAEVKPGSTVKIQGFVENLRNKRTMAFLVIRDISGKIQVTLEKEKSAEMYAVVDKLTIDSVVTIEGEAVANDYVKLGGIEILPSDIRIESIADALPIKPDSAIDSRLDYRWVDLRTERNTLIFKLQTDMVAAMRQFLLDHHFLEFHSPKIIGAASESGSEVFKLNYFDRDAYLAQSPQFYKQMAMAAGFERVFEVAPVFRAEKSHTSKHATEFTGLDLEFSYIDSFRDVMKFEEDMITDMMEKVVPKYADDIKRLYGLDTVVPTKPFPVMSVADIYRELEARYGYTAPESEKGDLTTDAERMTYKLAKEMFGHEFLFVTDFAADKRPFYHMRKDGVPQGYDLIWRGVEITSGAQREHRYAELCANAAEKGLGEDVKFYTEFFRYGCPPHGGFGVGVDRLTMLFLGISIKEAEFIFRGPDRLTP
ncbi:aspartyl/asparaginyl-tRNA synthetases [Anaerotruncus sp. CAG:390]|nr:aspartyl/asparaginyl-tRNA synthetases [Anaerotruncus sp. CAG:390]